MCGIAGFLLLRPPVVSFDPTRRLREMISTVRHRGPDDEGLWSDGDVRSRACEIGDHRSIARRTPANGRCRRPNLGDLQRRDIQL